MGVLLPGPVLRRVVRGRPAYERGRLYAQASRELGVRLVLFSPRGCALERGRVRGYVPARGGWRRFRGPLPEAVHNRILPKKAAHRVLLRRLHARLGRRLFNPPLSRDKWRVYRLLSRHPGLVPHLPPTWPLEPARAALACTLARRHGAVVAKPRVGGVGRGVVYIEALPGGRWRVVPSAGRPRHLTAAALAALLRRIASRRPYLLQAAVPLASYRGRRFDLRVPVQRDGSGAWTVPGAAVKRAWRHPF